MTLPIDPGLRVALRDASGETLRVFISREAVTELTAERDRLRQESRKLQEELALLREANKALGQERDQYLRSLRALTEDYFGVTEENLAIWRGKGCPGAVVLAEIEQIMRAGERNVTHG